MIKIASQCGTKGDRYHKATLSKILEEGYFDENPRPHYEDRYEDAAYDEGTNTVYGKNGSFFLVKPKGKQIKEESFPLQSNQWIKEDRGGDENGLLTVCTPAHTKSINHEIQQFDLSKGECPIETLRPVAWKSAVKEILWIYQMQSNKLSDLHGMGIYYWDDWDIGDGTIGCRYGATVKRWNLRAKLIDGLKKDPFGRRHIMNMWQEADFHDETGGTDKGLVPCCYETVWNVRKGEDGLYLDMLMNQRSSDYETSCAINEIQYIALQLMVAAECGYKPGMFTHVIDNVQIYDRHMEQAKTIIDREPVPCSAHLVLHGEGKHFEEFTIEDFEMVDYPLKEIREENPQLEFELGI